MPCVREVLTMQKLEQLIDKNFAETAHGKVANYIPIRSEERRVGKECQWLCRCGGGADE